MTLTKDSIQYQLKRRYSTGKGLTKRKAKKVRRGNGKYETVKKRS